MLCYQTKKDLRLFNYSNADWEGDVDQSKSILGYAFLLNDSAILWRSKKQSCIALSTMKTEYVACSATTQDVVWLKNFLYHLKIVKLASDQVIIYYDNTAAIAVVKDLKYYGNTKYIKM